MNDSLWADDWVPTGPTPGALATAIFQRLLDSEASLVDTAALGVAAGQAASKLAYTLHQGNNCAEARVVRVVVDVAFDQYVCRIDADGKRPFANPDGTVSTVFVSVHTLFHLPFGPAGDTVYSAESAGTTPGRWMPWASQKIPEKKAESLWDDLRARAEAILPWLSPEQRDKVCDLLSNMLGMKVSGGFMSFRRAEGMGTDGENVILRATVRWSPYAETRYTVAHDLQLSLPHHGLPLRPAETTAPSIAPWAWDVSGPAL